MSSTPLLSSTARHSLSKTSNTQRTFKRPTHILFELKVEQQSYFCFFPSSRKLREENINVIETIIKEYEDDNNANIRCDEDVIKCGVPKEKIENLKKGFFGASNNVPRRLNEFYESSANAYNVLDKKEQEPLNQEFLRAVYDEDLKKIKMALKNGANINAVIFSRGQCTALTVMASRGNTAIAQALITAGADVNLVGPGELSDSLNDTPLSNAIYGGHTAIVQMLLTSRANFGNEQYNAYLAHAISKGYRLIALAIIKAGANINEYNKKFNYKTALMYASIWGYPDIVQALLDKGADINPICDNGLTALQYTKQYSLPQVWSGSVPLSWENIKERFGSNSNFISHKKACAILIKNAFVIQFANKLLLNDNEKVKIVKEVALATTPLPSTLLDIVGGYNYIKITDINAAILAVHHFARENIDNVDKAIAFIEKHHIEALIRIQSENQSSNRKDDFLSSPTLSSAATSINDEYKQDDQGRIIYPLDTQSPLSLD